LGDEQPCIKKGPWDASDIKKFTRIMKEVLKASPAETVEDISPDAEDTSAPKVKIDWSDVSRRMDVSPYTYLFLCLTYLYCLM